MRKNILTITLLAFSVLCYTQTNFNKGYIIGHNEDTINGLINNLDWINSPEYIEFKKDSFSQLEIIPPHQIKGFEVSDNRYISAVVDIQNSNTTVDLTKSNDGLLNYTDHVFLKVIIEGELGLYKYAKGGSILCYYYNDHSKYKLLKYTRYMERRDAKYGGITLVYGDIKEKREYIGQLISIFKETTLDPKTIQQLDYNEKDLYRIFLEYYRTKDKEPNYILELQSLHHHYGIVVGVVLSKINFRYLGNKKSDAAFIADVNYPIASDYSAGIFYEIGFPGNHYRHSILNEAIITGYSIDSYDDSDEELIYQSDFDVTYVKLHSMYRNNQFLSLRSVFFNVGFSIGYLIEGTNSCIIEATENAGASAILQEKDVTLEFQPFEVGLVSGIGYRINSFSFELRHELGSGIFSAKSPILDNSSQLYLLGSYQF